MHGHFMCMYVCVCVSVCMYVTDGKTIRYNQSFEKRYVCVPVYCVFTMKD